MAGIAAIKDSIQIYVGELEDLKLADKMGNVSSIADLQGSAEEIDVTCLDSTSKEYEAGFVDEGNLELTINLTDQAKYEKLYDWHEGGATLHFGLVINDKKKTQVVGLKSKGVVTQLALTGMSVGGVIQAKLVIKIGAKLTKGFTAPVG